MTETSNTGLPPEYHILDDIEEEEAQAGYAAIDAKKLSQPPVAPRKKEAPSSRLENLGTEMDIASANPEAVEAFARFIGEAAANTHNFFDGAGKTIGGLAENAGETIGEAISNVGEVAGNIGETVGEAASGVAEAAGELAGGIIEGLGEIDL